MTTLRRDFRKAFGVSLTLLVLSFQAPTCPWSPRYAGRPTPPLGSSSRNGGVRRADARPVKMTEPRFPGTFSAPSRYARHMMIAAADFRAGDVGATEQALAGAGRLQR